MVAESTQRDGWLTDVLAATAAQRAAATSRLDAFLAEPRSARALAIWLAHEPGEPRPSMDDVLARLARDVATIDDLLGRQLQALLHHPSFQQLESAWRGLAWLVDSVPTDARVKVRVLTVTWKELSRDAERAIEFDQSQLFR
jgi:predicted component of type VI protein secretion system